MRRYIVGRLISLIPTLLGLSVLVFLFVRLVPGTVVDVLLGTEEMGSPEAMAAMRAFFGLDRPIHVQYAEWIGNLLRGDLGVSWNNGKPVLELILQRLPLTLQLTAGASLVAFAIGIPLGVLSALKPNTILDHILRLASLFSLSMPIFWQAAMIILLLSLWFRWTPPVDYVSPFKDPGTNFRMLIWPCIVLGTYSAATVMRMTRSSLLDVLRQDYILVAKAKGLRSSAVIWIHALKNALIPVLTIAGLQVGHLLGGAVVTEEVFTLPGIGRLVLWSIYKRDYPVVQGTVLFIGVMFALTNLLVDVIYGYVDPRISYK